VRLLVKMRMAGKLSLTGQSEKRLKSGLMITKCANPACSTVFRYLRGGKLFLFEVPQSMPTPVPPSPRE